MVAQGNGTTTGILLEMMPSARAVALGAYASVVGDEASVFVNPAGMAPIRAMAFGVSHDEDFLGARLTSAAVVRRFGRLNFGLGAMFLDLGGDSVIVPDPAFGGERGMFGGSLIEAYHALGVAAAAYRRGMFSVGASVKGLREVVDDGSANPYRLTAVTGDLGLALAVFDITSLALAVQNVAGGVSASGAGVAPAPLPRTVRFGWTINLVDPQGLQRLLLTTDWVRPTGGDQYWALGLEAGAMKSGMGIFARAGLALGRAPSDRRPYSWGAGIRVLGLWLDYSVESFRSAPRPLRRFSLRWVP